MRSGSGAILLGLVLAAPAFAETRPLDTYPEVGPYVARCWFPPRDRPKDLRVEITVGFALRRDGTIIGEPWITYSTPSLPGDLQERYKASVLKMLKDCAPIPLSSRLGAAIAGQQYRLRLIDDSNNAN